MEDDAISRFDLADHEDQIEFGLGELLAIQDDVHEGRCSDDEAGVITVEVALEVGRLFSEIREAFGADVFGIYVKVRWPWLGSDRVNRIIARHETANVGNIARARRRRLGSDA